MVFVKIGYYILVMPTLPCGIGQVAEKVRAAFQKPLPRFDLFHISFCRKIRHGIRQIAAQASACYTGSTSK